MTQAIPHLVLFGPLQETTAYEEVSPTAFEQEAEFAALVERNAKFLYRVAYSLLRRPQDAEDAVQECLLKLHRTGGWRGMKDERAFLARSCWRAALDRLPRKDIDFTEANDQNVFDEARSPEETAVERSQTAHLHRLIDRLPLELRQPLLLSGFEELNSREIGQMLQVPEGTVRTRLKRAREELKRLWLLSNRATPGKQERRS